MIYLFEPSFTGPPVATHSYLVPFKEGNLLVDAPSGSAEFFAETPIAALFITHAHFDHVFDAAAIVEKKRCQLIMSRQTEDFLANQEMFGYLDFAFSTPPLKASFYLEEGNNQRILGERVTILEVPGHCPGSVALYWPQEKIVYCGDTLFQRGLGRLDVPRANKEQLIASIKEKLLPLPPETHVLPGHGAMTTIGAEKESNPFLS